MQKKFLRILKDRPIIFDGATGTMLQKLGLKPGGCPDELNLTNPEIIKEVHRGNIHKGCKKRKGSCTITNCQLRTPNHFCCRRSWPHRQVPGGGGRFIL